MRYKIVIWGASSHAMVVADIVMLMNEYELVGFLDDINPERRNNIFCGLPIPGGREQLDNLKSTEVSHIIFGFDNCEARLKLSETARSCGFALATVVQPRSVIAENVLIGARTMIGAGAVVVKDVPDGVLAYGVPARVIRMIVEDGH